MPKVLGKDILQGELFNRNSFVKAGNMGGIHRETFTRLRERSELPTDINETFIVEFYSHY